MSHVRRWTGRRVASASTERWLRWWRGTSSALARGRIPWHRHRAKSLNRGLPGERHMTDQDARPDIGPLNPPDRILMGPGPSDVHPRVLRAMSTPLIGHLDPAFIWIMQEVQTLLRYAFRTSNRWTIPVSGTGSAAMEAAFANLVEPGDVVLVPTNGYFGARMESMARRAGGEVVRVHAPWGEPLDPDDVRTAFAKHRPRVFGFVHAETSTGALQPDVPALTRIAHEHDALVIVDAVTSLGGVELRVDEWNIDVAYSGAQKCLSCPPGASPLTLLPSHGADHRNLRTTRGSSARGRGGSRGALGTSSPDRGGAQGRDRGDGVAHEPGGRVLASEPQRGADPAGDRRPRPDPDHPP